MMALVIMLPGLSLAEQANEETRSRSLQRGGDGSVTWTPTPSGRQRFQYVLPQAAIREALRYHDTASLFYLSRSTEMPIRAVPSRMPNFSVAAAKNGRSARAEWAISHQHWVGLGVSESPNGADWTLTLKANVRPDLAGVTTLSAELGALNIYTIEHSKLGINENSETLFHGSVSDEDKGRLSLSYGQRFWDVISGLDVAWAAGVDQEDPFAAVQLERRINRATGALRLTQKSNASLSVGVGITWAFGGGHRGRWEGGVTHFENTRSALDVRSMGELRRGYLSTLWKQEVTVEALRELAD